jgi:hypothetical protein
MPCGFFLDHQVLLCSSRFFVLAQLHSAPLPFFPPLPSLFYPWVRGVGRAFQSSIPFSFFFSNLCFFLDDTGLKMCSLSGSTKTAKMIDTLIKGDTYHGLVITAGCLLELISGKRYSIGDRASIVIFDECHHTTGDHDYGKLLESLKEAKYRPRIGTFSPSHLIPSSWYSQINVIPKKNVIAHLTHFFSSDGGITFF